MAMPIPCPPGYPFVGNVFDINPENGMESFARLAQKYGRIYKLSFFGSDRYVVSDVALTAELCDERRFEKDIRGALEQLRPGVGAGLFTAENTEHDWDVAHKILVPAFGPIGIKNMFDEMYDLATQLIAKWARIGPDTAINVTDDFTRLTLDSIALCAMDKRFNSFYSPELHSFVGAMINFLLEGGRRVVRTRVQSFLNPSLERKFQEDIALMRSIAAEVIQHRRANSSSKKDLLNAMLYGKDPKTGERMTDENVMNNMLTFLIAGHETTSGLLSFTTFYLLKNPDVWQKAQREVDDVVGTGPVKYEHLSKLPYLEAILREALRLHPTAPIITVRPKQDTNEPFVLGGEYTLPRDANFLLLLSEVHRDPAVYGADADEFKPERMYGENFTKLPPGAWKPFGNGARGCIGRPFALQEALLTLALLMQNFDLRFDDPSYELKVKVTLTVKPDGFFMRARLRDGIDPITLEKRMFAGFDNIPSKGLPIAQKPQECAASALKPMTILYGGNSGTCEGLAQSLAAEAARHGFFADVKSLDAAIDQFPQTHPVVLISASYEGNAPDNAAAFVEWLKAADSSKFSGSEVAVFGCGHSDWTSTYQRIPRLLQSLLTEKGAQVTLPRGETNVAEGVIFDDFDTWTDKLWSTISSGEMTSDSEGLDMVVSTSARESHLRQSVQDAVVLKNDLLTQAGIPEKRHMEFKLPADTKYEAGDYLTILPINSMVPISRVLRRFGLRWDASLTLAEGAHTTIPTGVALPITVVLGTYVELNTPASKKNIATLVRHGAKAETFERESSHSVLDILEQQPNITLPFAVFVSMLTTMRIRQYSISSSPSKDPTVASITYSIMEGDGHLGVATTYLRHLQPGTKIQLAVRKSHASFHLPSDDNTPIIMIAAGSGLAPFHGFVQERAAKLAAGCTLGEAVLFIGCRDPREDKLYAEEFAKWETEGVVQLYYAYSQASNQSEGCKYAQDRLWHEKEHVARLFKDGAKAYICGSGRLGKGVADVAVRMRVEFARKECKEITVEEGLQWWNDLRNERYAVDVFD